MAIWADAVTSSDPIDPPADEMLWLLGQPTLEDYRAFVRNRVVGGEHERVEAISAWRAAGDRYFELAKAEAGAADDHVLQPLPLELDEKAAALAADPYFATTLDTFPTELAMVELGRLVVYQRHIAATYAEARSAQLTGGLTPEALFDFCLPQERAQPPVRIQRLAEGRYLFSSPSTDLRPHRPALLTAEQLAGFTSNGPIAGVIGLVVGYGSNFLSAIRYQGRLLLHNGYHRAYALHAAGFTHAPCVVQTVTRPDELRVAAADRVGDDPEHFFKGARPPLLRDFFDPALARRHRVLPCQTAVEVEFKLRSGVAATR